MAKTFKYCPLCGASLRLAKVDGRKRLICRECGWTHYENPSPVAVCAAVNGRGEILITRRKYSPGKGRWALPGGFIEKGETPEQACLRELKEETGINGKINKLAGIYIYKSAEYGDLLIVGYIVRASIGKIAVSDELEEAEFVNRNEMPVVPFHSHRDIIQKAMGNCRRPAIRKNRKGPKKLRKGTAERR